MQTDTFFVSGDFSFWRLERTEDPDGRKRGKDVKRVVIYIPVTVFRTTGFAMREPSTNFDHRVSDLIIWFECESCRLLTTRPVHRRRERRSCICFRIFVHILCLRTCCCFPLTASTTIRNSCSCIHCMWMSRVCDFLRVPCAQRVAGWAGAVYVYCVLHLLLRRQHASTSGKRRDISLSLNTRLVLPVSRLVKYFMITPYSIIIGKRISTINYLREIRECVCRVCVLGQMCNLYEIALTNMNTEWWG